MGAHGSGLHAAKYDDHSKVAEEVLSTLTYKDCLCYAPDPERLLIFGLCEVIYEPWTRHYKETFGYLHQSFPEFESLDLHEIFIMLTGLSHCLHHMGLCGILRGKGQQCSILYSG